jgi:hypothetical protein
VLVKVREHLLIVAKNGQIPEREIRALTGKKQTIPN